MKQYKSVNIYYEQDVRVDTCKTSFKFEKEVMIVTNYPQSFLFFREY